MGTGRVAPPPKRGDADAGFSLASASLVLEPIASAQRVWLGLPRSPFRHRVAWQDLRLALPASR